MSKKILILGGTKEAAALATELIAQGHDVTTSLAGRTKNPTQLAGKLRTGGFGGVEGLTRWLRENGITLVIDATHPFAEQISHNAFVAAQRAGVMLEVRTRPPWHRREGDIWTEVSDLDTAASAISANAHVLLALGSQHLAAFQQRDDVHFIIRMVDPPIQPLQFARHKVILGTPSPDWQQEADMLRREEISVIVCRNSGGTGAYAKIEAARRLALPVIMIARPA